MRRFQKSIFILLFIVLSFSCVQDKFDVSVSQVEIDYQSLRIDRELEKGEGIKKAHSDLLKNHELVYSEYFSKILRLGDVSQPSAHENVQQFIKNPTMLEVQAVIDSAFAPKKIFEAEFIDALKRVKNYLPDTKTPQIVFYNSGLNYGIYPTDDFIGVGLEWYVGSERELLKRLPPEMFPMYLKDKMDKKYLVTDALRGWLMVRYSDKIGGRQLLDNIVYFGKIAYLMDAIFPSVPEFVKYGYQEDEMAWCNANEFNVWRALVTEDLLYSNDGKLINSFIGNAPYTKGFSEDSPGRIAFYMGHAMVQDYMNENESKELIDLLDVTPQEILSAYRPKK